MRTPLRHFCTNQVLILEHVLCDMGFSDPALFFSHIWKNCPSTHTHTFYIYYYFFFFFQEEQAQEAAAAAAAEDREKKESEEKQV